MYCPPAGCPRNEVSQLQANRFKTTCSFRSTRRIMGALGANRQPIHNNSSNCPFHIFSIFSTSILSQICHLSVSFYFYLTVPTVEGSNDRMEKYERVMAQKPPNLQNLEVLQGVAVSCLRKEGQNIQLRRAGHWNSDHIRQCTLHCNHSNFKI